MTDSRCQNAPLRGWGKRLVIMAREPGAGRVKTRLARGLGDVATLKFYRQTLASLMRKTRADSRWQTVLSVAPDQSLHSSVWPKGMPVIGQGSGGLGQRMGHIMQVMPPGPVVVIGSDIPSIEVHMIARAFQQLGPHDCVFGPAEDGGYWLVGLKRVLPFPALFDNVRWSGPDALADTMANVADRRIGFVDQLNDIDNLQDYLRWTRVNRADR